MWFPIRILSHIYIKTSSVTKKIILWDGINWLIFMWMVVLKCRNWFCSVVYILITIFTPVWLIIISSIEQNNPFGDHTCSLGKIPFCSGNKTLGDLHCGDWSHVKTKTIPILKVILILVGSMYWMLILSTKSIKWFTFKSLINLFFITAYTVVIISLLTDEENKNKTSCLRSWIWITLKPEI